MSDPERNERESAEVEALAKRLAEKLRAMPNRDELTDYAVSVLRDSREEASQEEAAQRGIAKARKGDPFNPIAFAIPLFVIGLVLCATGILIGPGLGIIAIAILMVLYGLLVSVFVRRKGREDETAGDDRA